ncbi:MAG: hypothetical protein IJU23_04875 [Proteobacteria bacterium]|nr:hypothetical protein [Pseudomonadota bacterium]
MKHITLLLILASLFLICLTCCNTSTGKMKDLINNVETYHRDLKFERFEIAAKNITPSQRGAWLEAMLLQRLHFADIEILATRPCDITEASDTDGEKREENCIIVNSSVQWYVNDSPTLKTGRLRTTWEFDEEEKAWFITEQQEY